MELPLTEFGATGSPFADSSVGSPLADWGTAVHEVVVLRASRGKKHKGVRHVYVLGNIRSLVNSEVVSKHMQHQEEVYCRTFGVVCKY